MSKKKELGQFYTTNAQYITEGLLDIFPEGATIVEPFAGNWDLLNLVKDKHKVEAYDLDPKNDETEKRNSILNPPDYRKKWVFTNPPYLHKTRTKEKTVFEKLKTDDLYKASIKTMLEAEGGILIIPLNFFNASDKEFRKVFLSKFEVQKLKVFEKQIFDDTPLPVCAFSFIKKENTEQTLNTIFLPKGKEQKFKIKLEEGYTIGSEIFNLEQSNIKIKRLTNTKERPALSYLHIKCIDSGTEEGKVQMFWDREKYYGDENRKSYITVSFDQHIPIKYQKALVIDFNKKLNSYRKKYNSMFLSNFKACGRDMIRKRISYTLIYTIISNVLYEYGL
ncbi:Eco57I restriction-modification methylase domain-containing protein [uncultured Tissierella sp.]|uniref:Eco57I restriction-modification methylase domain-containing protein n=1 Tax=uncultured Tissierella sp. TaxID=448160 RepID=UPI002805E52E|nr:Eco57I restriction-modification methylase domain-containing protein [uncultured Tissierella sp.]MDU5082842.1 Eco57I restriction-modification methylase domain-containing protein [Bacillota bacterium]